ncbi:MAG TPA: DUF4252 domain-containing protein [Thermoanaerobaculia bacterium]|nr:DUF4252 domain-containing protein [Thermoanaerobaculia bacterium]
MMRTRALVFLIVFCAIGVGGARAATAEAPQKLEDQPGYVPLAELAIFSRQELTTEIDLEGPLLHLVGEATRNDDPEFSKLIGDLRAIRVQVAPTRGLDAAKVRAKMDETVRWLEAKGWHAIVRVKEKGEETYIYTREVHDQIVGLAVLSLEPGGDAAMVNIVGRLDVAQLGRLGRGLHLPQLDHAPSKDREKHPD